LLVLVHYYSFNAFYKAKKKAKRIKENILAQIFLNRKKEINDRKKKNKLKKQKKK